MPAVTLNCPQCRHSFSAAQAPGQRIVCPNCGANVPAPAVRKPAPAAPRPAAPAYQPYQLPLDEALAGWNPAPAVGGMLPAAAPRSKPRGNSQNLIIGLVAGAIVLILVGYGLFQLTGRGGGSNPKVTEETFEKELHAGMTLSQLEAVMGPAEEISADEVDDLCGDTGLLAGAMQNFLPLVTQGRLFGVQRWYKWEGGGRSIIAGLSRGGNNELGATLIQLNQRLPDGEKQSFRKAGGGASGAWPFGVDPFGGNPQASQPAAAPAPSGQPAAPGLLTRANFEQIAIGMTEGQVVALLGPPDRRNPEALQPFEAPPKHISLFWERPGSSGTARVTIVLIDSVVFHKSSMNLQ